MRKGKIAAILTASLIMLTLVGCGDSNESLKLSNDSFEYNGTRLSILDDLQTTLDKCDSVAKAGKTVKSNYIGVYNYDIVGADSELTVYSFDNNGKESLAQIEITKEGFKTPGGIGVGSTEEELVAIYGAPRNANDVRGAITFYTYEYDKFVIRFMLDGNRITDISYLTMDYYNPPEH